MNFGELLTDLYADLNQSDTPPAATVARYKRKLNQRYRRLLVTPGLSQLRDSSTFFTTVSGAPVVALPPVVARIKDIYDAATNRWKLKQRTLNWLRTTDPNAAATPGAPEAWIPLGLRFVNAQPAAGTPTALYIKSTSAADTTQTVAIQGTTAAGDNFVTTAVLNGTTAVAIVAAAVVQSIEKFELSAISGAGTVSLESAASGGTVYAQISQGHLNVKHYAVQLWPTPSSAIVMSVDYTRELLDMVLTYDEPMLPFDFHYLLLVGARLDLYEKQDDDRRLYLQKQWDDGIKALINWVSNSPETLIVPGGLEPERSSLGPWYPAGT